MPEIVRILESSLFVKKEEVRRAITNEEVRNHQMNEAVKKASWGGDYNFYLPLTHKKRKAPVNPPRL